MHRTLRWIANSSVHEILLDRGHVRIMGGAILCHRLVRRAEHNKKCELLIAIEPTLFFRIVFLLRVDSVSRTP